MEDKYEALRKILIDLLADFEKAKKKSKKASQISRSIGGHIQKDLSILNAKLNKLMEKAMKLEQETREI